MVASVAGADQGGIGAGCAAAGSDELIWGLAGLEIRGQWFNVAYGLAPPTVVSVDLTLSSGVVLSDGGVSSADGLWLHVFPADPIDPAHDITEIAAVDASGSIVAREEPPSIVEYRLRARANSGDD